MFRSVDLSHELSRLLIPALVALVGVSATAQSVCPHCRQPSHPGRLCWGWSNGKGGSGDLGSGRLGSGNPGVDFAERMKELEAQRERDKADLEAERQRIRDQFKQFEWTPARLPARTSPTDRDDEYYRLLRLVLEANATAESEEIEREGEAARQRELSLEQAEAEARADRAERQRREAAADRARLAKIEDQRQQRLAAEAAESAATEKREREGNEASLRRLREFDGGFPDPIQAAQDAVDFAGIVAEYDEVPYVGTILEVTGYGRDLVDACATGVRRNPEMVPTVACRSEMVKEFGRVVLKALGNIGVNAGCASTCAIPGVGPAACAIVRPTCTVVGGKIVDTSVDWATRKMTDAEFRDYLESRRQQINLRAPPPPPPALGPISINPPASGQRPPALLPIP
jgi:hypothetical protein